MTHSANPETDNSEQDDEQTQAQQVAEDARDPAFFDSESKHGGRREPTQLESDDQQDVVDHMSQMERSGQIDMDAYRGERSDDDESGMLGEGGMEPGDIDDAGNEKPGEE